ncbi:MAG TPA: glycoside hydrolase family 43 protein [Candidatus Hydrogenedentes bacterium]|nr:glycoside hydrolase family 43 protein [Candidatus Hydrogenedentota bacterium]HNT87873.1 glycoside hydrolase family 43 protein [Candidatus Hydrogenedentota bacterium]
MAWNIGLLMLLATGEATGAVGGSVPREAIAIRDPFILLVPEEGLYYMYGTRPKWGAEPFLCYTSKDLETWQGPIPVFEAPEGFWADRDFWAPEVHRWKGRYYLFATFARENSSARATHICVADAPRGPFVPIGNTPQTPKDWLCLDGTLFVDDAGDPWMVFCHEWLQVTDGEIQAMRLSEDLSRAEGEPILLFRASEAPWVAPKKDKVTDGPWLYRSKSGRLLMLWSSFGEDGKYKVGLARSRSGRIEGPWEQQAEPVFDGCGGHAMLFHTFDGLLMMSLHAPNAHPSRPTFFPMRDEGDTLRIIHTGDKTRD